MADAVPASEVICPNCGAPNEAGLPACLLCRTPLPGGAPGAGAAPPSYAPLATPGPAPSVLGYSAYGYASSPAPPGPAGRNGLWLGLGLGLLLGLCLMGLIGGGAFAMLGGGRLFAAATPTPEDPALLLERATAAQGNLKSLHYVLLAEFSDSSSGRQPEPVRLEGDVAFPDSYTVRSDVYGDRIVIGQDIYRRRVNGSGWQHSQIGDSPDDSAVMDPTQLLRALRYARNAALHADILSGTQRLREVALDVDIQRWAETEGENSAGAALATTEVSAVVRIDAATQRVERLTLLIQADQNAAGTFTLRLSDYDTPVKIMAPGDGGQ